MTALAYTCRSASVPYECGAAEYWAGRTAHVALGIIGALSLVVMAVTWWQNRRRR